MLKLSAFADEISPEVDEQVRVCRELGVPHVELRFVRGINVLDFSPELRAEVRDKLRGGGVGVVSIASPIGKVKINDPWLEHFDRFKVAVELAHYFQAPFIRIFSYYPPEKGGDIPARACGCTFCVKHGGVWTSHPRATLRARVSDAGMVARYAFGTETASGEAEVTIRWTLRGRHTGPFLGIQPTGLIAVAVGFGRADAEWNPPPYRTGWS